MEKLTEKSSIKVYNNTSGSLSFIGYDGKKVSFPKKDSMRKVSLDIIQALYNDCTSIIEDGCIVFGDKRVYEYLEVDESKVDKILTTENIEKFLEKDADEIEEELKEMPKQIKENVAKVAKEKNIDSTRTKRAIKKATGFDVDADSDEV